MLISIKVIWNCLHRYERSIRTIRNWKIKFDKWNAVKLKWLLKRNLRLIIIVKIKAIINDCFKKIIKWKC